MIQTEKNSPQSSYGDGAWQKSTSTAYKWWVSYQAYFASGTDWIVGEVNWLKVQLNRWPLMSMEIYQIIIIRKK